MHDTEDHPSRRCWYCGEVRVLWSKEHVIPLDMGGKLIVHRRVCEPCNNEAGKEIDGPFGRMFFVALQRAVYRVPRRSGGIAKAATLGDVEGGGRARIEWDGRGGDLQMWGTERGGRRRVRVQQRIDLRLWARFSAKVALGIASMAVDERWLDTDRGRELRAFVRDDVFPSGLWPHGAPLPHVLPKDDPVARRLRRDQHLISVLSSNGEAVVGMILFGAWATAVPIGVNMHPGQEVGWLLDPHRPTPQAQSYWQLMSDLEPRPEGPDTPVPDTR